VIDFNAAPDGQTSLTFGPVTFTAGGAPIYTTTYGNAPNGTRGIIANDGNAFVPFRADIAGGTSFVSIDLGDYNSDADNLYLRAYDASNNLIASATDFIDASFVGMKTLSVSAANIAYVRFGGTGFLEQSNVYADNFTYEGRGVPEPTTWAMMIAGFGLAGAAVRSRRRVSVLA
jgi:hypothetical protein